MKPLKKGDRVKVVTGLRDRRAAREFRRCKEVGVVTQPYITERGELAYFVRFPSIGFWATSRQWVRAMPVPRRKGGKS